MTGIFTQNFTFFTLPKLPTRFLQCVFELRILKVARPLAIYKVKILTLFCNFFFHIPS